MSNAAAEGQHTYLVRGHDGQMDRGIRTYDNVAEPVDAAGDYLQSYVADWRAGWVDQLKLSLRVWRAGEPEASAISFTGVANIKRGGDVMYLIERDSEVA